MALGGEAWLLVGGPAPPGGGPRHGQEDGVRLERVGKRYGIRQPWIVRDVNLDIPGGRLVRLEGRNGSGKSTLLRIIAGVSVPSSGRVIGRPGTGYVPERFPPGLPFSARDYLTHLGRAHGLAGQALGSRIDECLDRLGGAEFAAVPLRTMSKGMCQKVAVAQALLPRPGLLVLDEAWTGLDTAARAALDGAVAERLADGGAVVFVDHDPRRLAELGAERWQVSRGTVEVVADAPAGLAGGASSQGTAARKDLAANALAATGRHGGGPGAAGLAGDGLDGDGPAGAAAEPSGGRQVVIEVSGYPADLALPERLPGVLAMSRAQDRLTIRMDPAGSDIVLRALLAIGDQVRVRGVREEPGPQGRERGEQPGGRR
ncbi:MAG TPA: ABC transporter ATP-binding protein [Streptosporangiaceae bacterium]|nr:ABC transporter ATP-binding protein [Streptosporangiaceae bacterium]